MNTGKELEITDNDAAILTAVAQTVHQLARSKGWYDSQENELQFITRTVANIHGEVSELWEAARNNKLHDLCDKSEQMELANIDPLLCVEEELADIIIRAFDSACRIGVDIGAAIQQKHKFNATRPHRHGGKLA